MSDNVDKNLYSSVCVDDRKESEKVVNFLCDKGHKKIAILAAGKSDKSISKLRIEGYENALKNRNIPINKNLIRHFIRGYFDGDGCLTRHINKTIVTPVASILGTYEFLDSIVKYTGINGNVRHDHRHSGNTFSIEFNKKATISFINYIYDSSTIYLDRKYKLYEFFKNGSRSVEEFTELLSGNIGGKLVTENTEINSKIAKGFESSYSVVSE